MGITNIFKNSLSLMLLVLLGLTNACRKSSPQGPEISWFKTFGGVNNDRGYEVQETSDGGYIIAGETNSFGAGYIDVYLIKTDANGNVLWTKTYGGTINDKAFSVKETSDNGYIITGTTNSFSTHLVYDDYDVYLIKTDNNGDTVWTKTYGGFYGDEEGCEVQEISDGGFIIVGWTESFSNCADVYVIKTDGDGNTVWTKTYGGGFNDQGYAIQETADNGYIIVGSTEPDGTSTDFYLIKTDLYGNVIWANSYGGVYNEIGNSVQLTSDGGYIIAGTTWSFGKGTPSASNVDILRTDANGNDLWGGAYGDAEDEAGYSVELTTDNGYIIVGWTGSLGASGDVYLIKLDENGDSVWTKNYGGMASDVGYSVQPTADEGYIIAGYTSSFGAGGCDVYLIKTEPEPDEK